MRTDLLIKRGAALAALVGTLYGLPAGATPILCQNINLNHMYVDSQYVSACVDGGIGNLNGNPLTDDFLLANPSLDYTGIGGGTFTQSGTHGTFGLDSSLWNSWNSIAVGFKFGTGNNPDQWFVYTLNPLISSGLWDFVNVFGTGGGLSHVQLYGVTPTSVPEPGTLALFGASLVGVVIVRRFKGKKQSNA